MKISERIEGTIESWRIKWAETLKGWMSSWLAWGIEVFFDVLGLAFAPLLKPLVDRIRTTDVPDELKPLLDEIENPKGEVAAMLGYSAAGAGTGGIISSTLGPILLKYCQYSIQAWVRQYLPPEAQLILAKWRGVLSQDEVTEIMKKLGYEDSWIDKVEDIYKFLPSATDIVTWYAREVYEPDMIERYGLDSELPVFEGTDFPKIGVDAEQARNYWRAHWEHASWMQVVEMLHRGLLTEEDVWDWFRLVEIPPFWRQHLIDTAYTWPTRVDVRRWWDMRTIDETELRRLYSGMGYRGVNLDNYVLWTKVYVAFPDLMARWGKGWISLDDVRAELTALGMPAERLEEMIQMKIKPEETGRIASERDVTKTDIYKGVKQGVITRSEGIELLMDLGFDEDEADYLLTINIPQDEEAAVVTTRELTKADILNGLKTGIITEAEAHTRLVELRYTSTDARTILDIFKAAAEPPVEAWQREASKADIVAAVKTGLITPENAYLMLLDIGFSPEAANFILMVRAEVSPFSPMSYNEFKDITTKYRRVAGREVKPMPEELKKVADEVVRVTGEIESLKRSIEEEQRGLVAEEVLPAAATARRKKLQVSLHRAEAELSRVQSEYNRLVAEWRHGE